DALTPADGEAVRPTRDGDGHAVTYPSDGSAFDRDSDGRHGARDHVLRPQALRRYPAPAERYDSGGNPDSLALNRCRLLDRCRRKAGPGWGRGGPLCI